MNELEARNSPIQWKIVYSHSILPFNPPEQKRTQTSDGAAETGRAISARCNTSRVESCESRCAPLERAFNIQQILMTLPEVIDHQRSAMRALKSNHQCVKPSGVREEYNKHVRNLKGPARTGQHLCATVSGHIQVASCTVGALFFCIVEHQWHSHKSLTIDKTRSMNSNAKKQLDRRG